MACIIVWFNLFPLRDKKLILPCQNCHLYDLRIGFKIRRISILLQHVYQKRQTFFINFLIENLIYLYVTFPFFAKKVASLTYNMPPYIQNSPHFKLKYLQKMTAVFTLSWSALDSYLHYLGGRD